MDIDILKALLYNIICTSNSINIFKSMLFDIKQYFYFRILIQYANDYQLSFYLHVHRANSNQESYDESTFQYQHG